MTVFARVSRSIAFRSGYAARVLVSALPVRCAAGPIAPGPRLLTQVGAAHLPYLRQCLWSAAASWSACPRLTIVDDGTAGEAAIRWAAAAWPDPVDILHAADIIAAADAYLTELASFARRSAVGLKFAAIVLSAREQPTLFSDPDVLWYRDFTAELQDVPRAGDVRLALCHDFQGAYDRRIIPAGTDLHTPPFYNSGVVFLDGDLLLVPGVREALSAATRASSHFTEQTLFAIAGRRVHARVWAPESIVCSQSDQFSLAVTYRRRSWFARHYVGPVRHLFWRDALALRMGIRP